MIANNMFECKVKTEKTLESGQTKQVTEPYLVDALNFTEAEARIIEEIAPFANGQLDVVGIKRAKFNEIFPSDLESADKWYKVKCMFIIVDEKTGVEKKSATNYLVQAGDFRQAVKLFDENMKGTMQDYEINTVSETLIMDVFPFKPRTREGENPVPEQA